MSRRKSSQLYSQIFWQMAVAGYVYFVRPQMARWGARLGEPVRRLPGDDQIPMPNYEATRAVDIDAPVEAVWPWLAQMGRSRTGWYSYAMLDNNGIPSAAYLRKDIEAPEVGMSLDHGLQVLDIKENRQLLIGGLDIPNPLGTSTDLTLLYLLERKSDGSTRLLFRLRTYSYGIMGRVFNYVLEPLDFAMSRKQLLGLKHRAETMAHLGSGIHLEQAIELS